MIPERELIERIRKIAAHPSQNRARVGHPQVVEGIGDDCAILRVKPGCEALVTTDFSLEGVHFRKDWYGPAVIGHRCLVRGLSDIAAMGGEPVAIFLSLGLPKDVRQEWVNGFLAGLMGLAKRYGVALAGGDVAQSPGRVLADVVAVGQAPKGEALRRSGARPGDGIYVTGCLGGPAALVRKLRYLSSPKGKRDEKSSIARIARKYGTTAAVIMSVEGYPAKASMEREFIDALMPKPRIEAGRILRGIASACIDVSDGLSTDLSHICAESGVGAVIEAEAVPLAKGATLELALHGGEDYELLFTSAKPVPEKIAGVRVTLIGEMVKKGKMELVDAAGKRRELQAKGWEHFRK